MSLSIQAHALYVISKDLPCPSCHNMVDLRVHRAMTRIWSRLNLLCDSWTTWVKPCLATNWPWSWRRCSGRRRRLLSGGQWRLWWSGARWWGTWRTWERDCCPIRWPNTTRSTAEAATFWSIFTQHLKSSRLCLITCTGTWTWWGPPCWRRTPRHRAVTAVVLNSDWM